MADRRKFFRTRRLAFGGRMLPCVCLVVAVLFTGTAVHAQDAGLKSGAASLAAGKYNDAVRQLSATINSDNASPGDAAKALYMRGIAYRKIGEPARAAADLGAAIWLGLPEPDRVKALVNRGLAFQAAGLSKEGEADIASARRIGGSREVDQLIADGGGAPEGAAAIAAFSTEVRPEGQESASSERSSWFPSLSRLRGETAPPAPQPETPPTRTASASPQWSTTTSKPSETAEPGAWNTSVAGAEQPSGSSSSGSSGNRLTRWFGSLSDSSSSAPSSSPAPPTTAAASPQPSSPQSSPPTAAASSSWSTTTENSAAGAASSETKRSWRIFGRTAEAEPEAQPAAQATAAGGGYRLQLANSRSKEEADALWKKVSQSQGLGGMNPEIEKIEIGDFGTFYSLKIGPFPDKAQSVKVCNALKRSGIDCLPVTL